MTTKQETQAEVVEAEDQTEASNTQTASLQQAVDAHVTLDEYKPYGIAKSLNAVLADLDLKVQVRPQMLYNYDRQGLIVPKRPNKKTYNRQEVKSWISKYVEKNFQ